MAASEHPARPKPAFVYMVRCTGGQLYTGWTNAPAARLQAHKSGRGARYTRARGAAAFAYVERCADKRSALRREAALKKLPKAQLFTDISADSQKAARWCVEQGLLKDTGSTFKPDKHTFRPQVIKAWNDLQARLNPQK